MEVNYCKLLNRGVLRLSGSDVLPFLQALITRNLDSFSPENAVYSALLTPQGKYLFDFFLVQSGDTIYLDGESARLEELTKLLSLYRLRADVNLEDLRTDLGVFAFFGDGVEAAFGLQGGMGGSKQIGEAIAFSDPRLNNAGVRIISPPSYLDEVPEIAEFRLVDYADYDYFRLGMGLPESSRDLIVNKSLMMESNFDFLHGVDFDKGCFVGQELTARTKYRALVRKRLLPIRIDGALPSPGAPLLAGKEEIGLMRSGLSDRGMALIRLKRLAEVGGWETSLNSGFSTIKIFLPEWAEINLPESKI